MSEKESKILRTIIALAYNKESTETYTTADLLSSINHNLTGVRQMYLGTKFYYYVIKRPSKFEIIRSTGNNKYRTR